MESYDKKESFWNRPDVKAEMSVFDDKTLLLRYMAFRYKYEIWPAAKVALKYPPLLQIEPTSICNYRCTFCYQIDSRLSDKKNGHMGVMDLDLFKRIVNDIEGNVDAITLASRGEPTLNKFLPEMLRYAAGKFVNVKINTNASRLNEKLVRSILESGVSTVVFSADAVDGDNYADIRVNGSLDKVLAGINLFNRLRDRFYPESKVITRVSGVKAPNVIAKSSEMNEFWGAIADQVTFVSYNPWENVYDKPPSGVNEPCSDLWRRFFIWWDGRPGVCDVDYLNHLGLGEMKFPEFSIADIWTSEFYNEMRKMHVSGARSSMNPCSKCEVV